MRTTPPSARHLTGVHVQRDVLQRNDVAEILGDMLELQQMHRIAVRPVHSHLARSARRRMAVLSITAATRTTPSKKYTQFESQPEEMIPI